MHTEFVLAHALFRKRLGDGAMLIGMRDFSHLALDTVDAAKTRQVWITYATLDELAQLKEFDARLSDVECATRELIEAQVGFEMVFWVFIH